MAQAMINFRMDEELKKNMEKICQEMGMSMTTAFTIFAKKVTKERRIPFEVSADPFYSESNMRYLETVISNIENNIEYMKSKYLFVINPDRYFSKHIKIMSFIIPKNTTNPIILIHCINDFSIDKEKLYSFFL